MFPPSLESSSAPASGYTGSPEPTRFTQAYEGDALKLELGAAMGMEDVQYDGASSNEYAESSGSQPTPPLLSSYQTSYGFQAGSYDAYSAIDQSGTAYGAPYPLAPAPPFRPFFPSSHLAAPSRLISTSDIPYNQLPSTAAPAHVHDAHTALRGAVSHPNFSTSSDRKHHPYARASIGLPSNGEHLGRSVSTTALRPYGPSRYASGSTARFTAGSDCALSVGAGYSSIFGSAATQNGVLSSAGSYHSSLGSSTSYAPHQLAPTGANAGMPPHLFMSGLGGQAGGQAVDDEETWRNIKGNGLWGERYIDEEVDELDEDDEEVEAEDDELDSIKGDNEHNRSSPASFPTADIAEVDEDLEADSDDDIPLAQTQRGHAAWNRQLSVTPTPAPTLIPTPAAAPVPAETSAHGSGVSGLDLDVEEEVESTPVIPAKKLDEEEAIGAPARHQGQDEEEGEEEEELRTMTSSTRTGFPNTRTRSTQRKTSSLSTSAVRTDVIDDTSSIIFHPSGRAMRNSTAATIKTEPVSFIPLSSTQRSSQSSAVEEDEWSDANSDDDDSDAYPSRSGTPLFEVGRNDTVARRVGKKGQKSRAPKDDDEERRRLNPDLYNKVDTLRNRMMGIDTRLMVFDEKLCLLLVDDRFSPEFIRWDETGTHVVIPDFAAFWPVASAYVTLSVKQVQWSAFDKQLSNFGFRRTSHNSHDKKSKIFRHANLRRDDKELWDHVRALPRLLKHQTALKNTHSGSSSSSPGDRKTPSALRAIIKTQASELSAKDARISDLESTMAGLSIKADKADQYERFLVEHRKLYPELWTEEDAKKLGLDLSGLPDYSTDSPAPSSSSSGKRLLSLAAVAEVRKPVKITRKRSRAIMAPQAEDGVSEAEHKDEAVVSPESGGAAQKGKTGKTVSRKRSKLVLGVKQ
ncbi:uncharacterized protein MKK02DRAFT_28479 [Dioszegia hungarica]|uniref:HSF-type DNA-binding domain-containing protein n=1 Tax=Dioszegia hungarica TaxID=4972 RepID=A0AA38H421_9TREE|nr:uncharacterized protein MKK02DRAFT_28479 [Dioszegia hungarica]KAI9633693.1 hypothetical protein MKK02DRAFT_28479 [Dioszegia hungarica]